MGAFTNTPQAKDDLYTTNVTGLTEDHLTIVYLGVTANDDLGGNGKTLWSVDNGVNNTGAMSGFIAADLLTQDEARAEATSGDTSLNGAKIWITDDGKVGYDASTLSDAFKAQLASLGSNETLTDTFIYAIRLGNGALSWATATVQFGGSNEAVTITNAPQSGLVVEDAPLARSGDSLSATGTISFTDGDLGDGHTASFVADPRQYNRARYLLARPRQRGRQCRQRFRAVALRAQQRSRAVFGRRPERRGTLHRNGG